jgi:hypothetical protein
MKRIAWALVRFAVMLAIRSTVVLAITVAVQAHQKRPPSEGTMHEATIQSVQQVTQQIGDFISDAENWGFEQVANETVEMINEGTASFAVPLEYHMAYAIAARCGGECNRLVLVLKDASGQVVQSIDSLNDKPHFVYRPSLDGVYVLSLELAGCSQSHCQVGVVVLAQPERQRPWRHVFAYPGAL